MEMRWTMRWLRRWQLIALMLICLLIPVVTAINTLSINQTPQAGASTGSFVGGPTSSTIVSYRLPAFGSMGMIPWLIHYGLWIHLLRRRTLRLFRKDRLHDIFLTPIRTKELWPALLCAPVLARIVFLLLGQMGWIWIMAVSLSGKSPGWISSYYQSNGIDSVGVWKAWLFYPLSFFCAVIYLPAITAFVAWLIVPLDGAVSIVLLGLLGWGVTGIPNAVIFIAYVMVSLAGFPTTPSSASLYSVILIVFPLMKILMSLLVFRISLKGLRGPKVLERLRQVVEKP